MAGQDTLSTQGDSSLFASPTAAILNSRKPRMITPSDCWIKITIALTEEAVRKGFTVVSSLGMFTYDLVTFIAAQMGAPTIIVLDGLLPELLSSDKQAEFYEEFAGLFDPEKTLFVSPFPPDVKMPDRAARDFERDRWVVFLASRVLAGEIRSGGYMEKLSLAAINEGRRVQAFRPSVFDKSTAGNRALLAAGAEEVTVADFPVKKVSYRPNMPQTRLVASNSPSLKPSFDLSEYLFHYTRGCYGPWPGQSRADYIRSLADGDNDAGHTGFDTLCRILCERLIRAGHRLVRGNVPVVSFSACPPTQLANIRKWNPALIRWTFEPYTVGIHRAALEEMGARPAIYGPETKFRELSEAERFRFQLHAPPKTDWSNEKEWRIAGDVDLSRLSPEGIIAVVPTKKEAVAIQEKSAIPVVNLYSTRA